LNDKCSVIKLSFGGTFDNLSDNIYNNFSSLPAITGVIRIGNDVTLYHGTYMKYSNTIGSILLTDVGGTGEQYIWHTSNGTYGLEKVTTNVYKTKVGTASIALASDGNGFLQIDGSAHSYAYAVIQVINDNVVCTKCLVNEMASAFSINFRDFSGNPITNYSIDVMYVIYYL